MGGCTQSKPKTAPKVQGRSNREKNEAKAFSTSSPPSPPRGGKENGVNSKPKVPDVRDGNPRLARHSEIERGDKLASNRSPNKSPSPTRQKHEKVHVATPTRSAPPPARARTVSSPPPARSSNDRPARVEKHHQGHADSNKPSPLSSKATTSRRAQNNHSNGTLSSDASASPPQVSLSGKGASSPSKSKTSAADTGSGNGLANKKQRVQAQAPAEKVKREGDEFLRDATKKTVNATKSKNDNAHHNGSGGGGHSHRNSAATASRPSKARAASVPLASSAKSYGGHPQTLPTHSMSGEVPPPHHDHHHHHRSHHQNKSASAHQRKEEEVLLPPRRDLPTSNIINECKREGYISKAAAAERNNANKEEKEEEEERKQHQHQEEQQTQEQYQQNTFYVSPHTSYRCESDGDAGAGAGHAVANNGRSSRLSSRSELFLSSQSTLTTCRSNVSSRRQSDNNSDFNLNTNMNGIRQEAVDGVKGKEKEEEGAMSSSLFKNKGGDHSVGASHSVYLEQEQAQEQERQRIMRDKKEKENDTDNTCKAKDHQSLREPKRKESIIRDESPPVSARRSFGWGEGGDATTMNTNSNSTIMMRMKGDQTGAPAFFKFPSTNTYSPLVASAAVPCPLPLASTSSASSSGASRNPKEQLSPFPIAGDSSSSRCEQTAATTVTNDYGLLYRGGRKESIRRESIAVYDPQLLFGTASSSVGDGGGVGESHLGPLPQHHHDDRDPPSSSSEMHPKRQQVEGNDRGCGVEKKAPKKDSTTPANINSAHYVYAELDASIICTLSHWWGALEEAEEAKMRHERERLRLALREALSTMVGGGADDEEEEEEDDERKGKEAPFRGHIDGIANGIGDQRRQQQKEGTADYDDNNDYGRQHRAHPLCGDGAVRPLPHHSSGLSSPSSPLPLIPESLARNPSKYLAFAEQFPELSDALDQHLSSRYENKNDNSGAVLLPKKLLEQREEDKDNTNDNSDDHIHHQCSSAFSSKTVAERPCLPPDMLFPPSDTFHRMVLALGDSAVVGLFLQLWLVAHVTGWYMYSSHKGNEDDDHGRILEAPREHECQTPKSAKQPQAEEEAVTYGSDEEHRTPRIEQIHRFLAKNGVPIVSFEGCYLNTATPPSDPTLANTLRTDEEGTTKLALLSPPLSTCRCHCHSDTSELSHQQQHPRSYLRQSQRYLSPDAAVHSSFYHYRFANARVAAVATATTAMNTTMYPYLVKIITYQTTAKKAAAARKARANADGGMLRRAAHKKHMNANTKRSVGGTHSVLMSFSQHQLKRQESFHREHSPQRRNPRHRGDNDYFLENTNEALVDWNVNSTDDVGDYDDHEEDAEDGHRLLFDPQHYTPSGLDNEMYFVRRHRQRLAEEKLRRRRILERAQQQQQQEHHQHLDSSTPDGSVAATGHACTSGVGWDVASAGSTLHTWTSNSGPATRVHAAARASSSSFRSPLSPNQSTHISSSPFSSTVSKTTQERHRGRRGSSSDLLESAALSSSSYRRGRGNYNTHDADDYDDDDRGDAYGYRSRGEGSLQTVVGTSLPRVGLVHSECLESAYASLLERRAFVLLSVRQCALKEDNLTAVEEPSSYLLPTTSVPLSPYARHWLASSHLTIPPSSPAAAAAADATAGGHHTNENHRHNTVTTDCGYAQGQERGRVEERAAASAVAMASTTNANQPQQQQQQQLALTLIDGMLTEIRRLLGGSTSTATTTNATNATTTKTLSSASAFSLSPFDDQKRRTYGGSGGPLTTCVVSSSNPPSLIVRHQMLPREAFLWRIAGRDSAKFGDEVVEKKNETGGEQYDDALQISTHTLIKFYLNLDSVTLAARDQLSALVGGRYAEQGQLAALIAAEDIAESMAIEDGIAGAYHQDEREEGRKQCYYERKGGHNNNDNSNSDDYEGVEGGITSDTETDTDSYDLDNSSSSTRATEAAEIGRVSVVEGGDCSTCCCAEKVMHAGRDESNLEISGMRRATKMKRIKLLTTKEMLSRLKSVNKGLSILAQAADKQIFSDKELRVFDGQQIDRLVFGGDDSSFHFKRRQRGRGWAKDEEASRILLEASALPRDRSAKQLVVNALAAAFCEESLFCSQLTSTTTPTPPLTANALLLNSADFSSPAASLPLHKNTHSADLLQRTIQLQTAVLTSSAFSTHPPSAILSVEGVRTISAFRKSKNNDEDTTTTVSKSKHKHKDKEPTVKRGGTECSQQSGSTSKIKNNNNSSINDRHQENKISTKHHEMRSAAAAAADEEESKQSRRRHSSTSSALGREESSMHVKPPMVESSNFSAHSSGVTVSRKTESVPSDAAKNESASFAPPHQNEAKKCVHFKLFPYSSFPNTNNSASSLSSRHTPPLFRNKGLSQLRAQMQILTLGMIPTRSSNAFSRGEGNAANSIITSASAAADRGFLAMRCSSSTAVIFGKKEPMDEHRD